MRRPSDILPGSPAYDLHEHFKYLLKLRQHFPSEEEDKKCIMAVAAQLVSLERVECLMPRLTRFIDRLFYENSIMYRDKLEDFPTNRELYIEMEDRMLDKNREDRAFVAVQKFYLKLMQILPPVAKQPYRKRDAEGDAEFDESAAIVPFADVVNLYALFQIARDEFSVEDGPGKYTFHLTRWTMGQNILRAAGHAPETYRGQSIDIQKCDPQALLHNTPFEELLKARIEFAIPEKYWKEHCAIFAPTGHGKTQLLQHQIVSFLQQPDPPAMFIIDSMGAMLRKIERLAVFTTTLKDRLVILDPHDESPPSLNFFKLRGGSPAQQQALFHYLFAAIDQSLTTRQGTLVNFLLRLMTQMQGTLDTLRAVMEEKVKKVEDAFWYAEHFSKLDPLAQNFFRNQFFAPGQMAQTREQVVNRLYTILVNPIFNRMFGARENTFDPLRCMQERKIVLINTDREFLGDEASAVFGRFVLAQCLAASFSRPESKRDLALLIVDEAKAYFDDRTEKILSDARQFGLGLVFASQQPHQLPEGVRREMYANTAIKLMGPIAYGDRITLAREMNTTPEFIGSMRSYDRKAVEFACHVRNYTDRAIKLTVPFGVLEEAPTMTDTQHGIMRATNRQRHSRQPPPPVQRETSVPPIPQPSVAAARPTFIPGIGVQVRVLVNGFDWYRHGAVITKIDVTAAYAWVDPRPFAQPGDPPHSFELPQAAVSFADLAPYEGPAAPAHEDLI